MSMHAAFKVPEGYRSITIEEAKKLKYGDRVEFLSLSGKVKTAKVNGNPRRWERNADRVRVPVKYGLYEYGYFASYPEDGEPLGRIIVKLAEVSE